MQLLKMLDQSYSILLSLFMEGLVVADIVHICLGQLLNLVSLDKLLSSMTTCCYTQPSMSIAREPSRWAAALQAGSLDMLAFLLMPSGAKLCLRLCDKPSATSCAGKAHVHFQPGLKGSWQLWQT